jgi:hypothetical protein
MAVVTYVLLKSWTTQVPMHLLSLDRKVGAGEDTEHRLLSKEDILTPGRTSMDR